MLKCIMREKVMGNMGRRENGEKERKRERETHIICFGSSSIEIGVKEVIKRNKDESGIDKIL